MAHKLAVLLGSVLLGSTSFGKTDIELGSRVNTLLRVRYKMPTIPRHPHNTSMFLIPVSP